MNRSFAHVYYLCSADEEPRYVGVTTRPLFKRLYFHIAGARENAPNEVYKWIREVDFNVCIHKLETVDYNDRFLAEKRWTRAFLDDGADLRQVYNTQKEKSIRSLARTGQVYTEIGKAKLSAAKAGRVQSAKAAAASRRNGAFGRHVRNHVNNEFFKPECEFCKGTAK